MTNSQPDNLILYAARFAVGAHTGQARYDGEPYINHPMRVAGTVSMLSPTNATLVAAAWLHDVVEDCNVPLIRLAGLFGGDVAELVEHMTNVYTKDCYPSMNRRDRKAMELARIAETQDYHVHTLKLADRLDNVTGALGKNNPKWARKYLRESAALVEALDQGHEYLREQLRERIEHMETLL